MNQNRQKVNKLKTKAHKRSYLHSFGDVFINVLELGRPEDGRPAGGLIQSKDIGGRLRWYVLAYGQITLILIGHHQ